MRRNSGFSFPEVLATIALMGIIAGIGVPMVVSGMDSMKLGGDVRAVQSELQAARLKAVTANRPIRVRFNCPSTGRFRRVELIGTPAAPDPKDGAANRCDPSAYPYPPADVNALTRPNHDGPVQYLKSGVTFSASQSIEFWPDGTAHMDSGGSSPWPVIAGSGISVTLSYKSQTKSITVNGVGKVQIVQ